MYATNSRVLASVAGQLRKARVVSKVNDLDAYVIAVQGRRITVHGSTLTTNSKGERS